MSGAVFFAEIGLHFLDQSLLAMLFHVNLDFLVKLMQFFGSYQWH